MSRSLIFVAAVALAVALAVMTAPAMASSSEVALEVETPLPSSSFETEPSLVDASSDVAFLEAEVEAEIDADAEEASSDDSDSFAELDEEELEASSDDSDSFTELDEEELEASSNDSDSFAELDEESSDDTDSFVEVDEEELAPPRASKQAASKKAAPKKKKIAAARKSGNPKAARKAKRRAEAETPRQLFNSNYPARREACYGQLDLVRAGFDEAKRVAVRRERRALWNAIGRLEWDLAHSNVNTTAAQKRQFFGRAVHHFRLAVYRTKVAFARARGSFLINEQAVRRACRVRLNRRRSYSSAVPTYVPQMLEHLITLKTAYGKKQIDHTRSRLARVYKSRGDGRITFWRRLEEIDNKATVSYGLPTVYDRHREKWEKQARDSQKYVATAATSAEQALERRRFQELECVRSADSRDAFVRCNV